jgi:uncharacterized membrane protein
LRGIVIALAVSYPLVAHLAVLTGSPRLTVASLAVLVALALWPALARRGALAWLAALVAAAAVALSLVAAQGWPWLPLYAPPVLGDAFLAWLFGHTLARGQVPLIERMVYLVHAPAPGEALDAAVLSYARTLTAAWAALFAVLGLTNLLLALCATPNGILVLLGRVPLLAVPQRAWSWFANIAEYLIVAGVFVGEYAYRRRRFPQRPYAGLVDFLRRLSAVAPRILERAPRAMHRVSDRT